MLLNLDEAEHSENSVHVILFIMVMFVLKVRFFSFSSQVTYSVFV